MVQKTSNSGLLLCAKYALAPNLLSFCGPPKQQNLYEYIKKNKTDAGLVEILNQFPTLYPYLSLIAMSNNIKDIFDRRVVEAYFIGNQLIENIDQAKMYSHISDTLNFKKKLKKSKRSQILDNSALGFPHHTYHVINMFIHIKHHAIGNLIETIDACRVSWGEVLETSSKGDITYVNIKSQSITFAGGVLELKGGVFKQVSALNLKPKKGDLVSVHWGQICDKLTKPQVRNLNNYTLKAIKLANITNAVNI